MQYNRIGPAYVHDLQTMLQLWSLLHFQSLEIPQEVLSSGNTAEPGAPSENQESPPSELP